MILRPYQHNVIAALEASAARRKILIAPTGAGKSVIAAEIIRRAEQKRVLFLAHRRELIHQTRDHLRAIDLDAGIILAGEEVDPDARVQVASVQTLWTRAMVRGTAELPLADLVFLDECHHAPARTYRRLIDSYPEAQIIGLTATPCRGDGRGLGGIFEAMVECPQIRKLIDQDHLVGTKVYAPSMPDLKGVHTRAGDYVQETLAERVDRPTLVGDIVSHWQRLADRRKTVVFATSVAHSIHIADEFGKAGVKAAHIDGATPKDERDEILARLRRGDLEVVVNCMVLTEGFDLPDLGCIVLARPTKHHGLFRQMIGRGLRPAPGKDHCLVLDHAGAVFQHGLVEDPVEWSLDPDKRAELPAQASRSRGLSASPLVACKECSAIRTAGKPCPACGHMPRRPGRSLDVVDGDLSEIDRNRRRAGAGRVFTEEDRQRWHAMLVGIALERGYKLGWVAHKHKEKFGTWPAERFVEPLAPSPEVRSWCRSRNIAWAKAQEKARANG